MDLFGSFEEFNAFLGELRPTIEKLVLLELKQFTGAKSLTPADESVVWKRMALFIYQSLLKVRPSALSRNDLDENITMCNFTLLLKLLEMSHRNPYSTTNMYNCWIIMKNPPTLIQYLDEIKWSRSVCPRSVAINKYMIGVRKFCVKKELTKKRLPKLLPGIQFFINLPPP